MSANVPVNRLGPVAENQPEAGWGQWLIQIARGVNFLLQNLGTTPITTVGDAAYLIVQSDRLIETSTAFTAARIWTLPPANSVDRGYEIEILDAIATITATNTLTVALSGADTINGTAASLVLNRAGASAKFVSDGLSNWGIRTLRGSLGSSIATPAAPAGTTSLTGLMAGLAVSMLPRASGLVMLDLAGDMFNSGAGNGVIVQLRYGTGSAPANGDAPSGTVAGSLQSAIIDTAINAVGFAIPGLVAMTPGTTYWIDARVSAFTGGTASITNVTVRAVEMTL